MRGPRDEVTRSARAETAGAPASRDEAVLAEPPVERGAREPERARDVGDVAFMMFERLADHFTLDVAEGHLSHRGQRSGPPRGRAPRLERFARGQVGDAQPVVIREKSRPLERRAKLPDIARPG